MSDLKFVLRHLLAFHLTLCLFWFLPKPHPIQEVSGLLSKTKKKKPFQIILIIVGLTVFGCTEKGESSNDLILSALLHAVKDGGQSFNHSTLDSFYLCFSKSQGSDSWLLTSNSRCHLSLSGWNRWLGLRWTSFGYHQQLGWKKGSHHHHRRRQRWRSTWDSLNCLECQTKQNLSFWWSWASHTFTPTQEGLYSGLSPAAALNALSVGSVESSALMSTQLLTSTGKRLSYYTAQAFNETEAFQVYRTSNSTTEMRDACEDLPESTPDLSDYVVLIRRG